MTHVITLIPGDGIGPEVTEAVIRIFKAAALDIEWERHDAGVTAFKKYNQSLPAALLESIRRNKVALKGPVTTPIAEGFTSVNVGLRKALELYANLRPVRNLPGVASRFSGVDLVIVRENTEDLYAGLEHEIVPGVVESLKIITEKASTRVSQFAFQHARANGRRRVTAIHKANIMKLSDGLFLESTRKVSREFTDITYDERIVDAACMHLVMRPESSTCCCSRTSMATSCPICARDWSAGSASCRGRTWGPIAPCSRRSTGARPTSPTRTWRTPPPCCCPA